MKPHDRRKHQSLRAEYVGRQLSRGGCERLAIPLRIHRRGGETQLRYRKRSTGKYKNGSRTARQPVHGILAARCRCGNPICSSPAPTPCLSRYGSSCYHVAESSCLEALSQCRPELGVVCLVTVAANYVAPATTLCVRRSNGSVSPIPDNVVSRYCRFTRVFHRFSVSLSFVVDGSREKHIGGCYSIQQDSRKYLNAYGWINLVCMVHESI